MKKIILAFVAIIGVSCLPTASNQYQIPTSDVAHRSSKAVVVVLQYCSGELTSRGSGAVVGAGNRILTAAHVVDNGECEYRVSADKKTFHVAAVTRINEDRDLALLRTLHTFPVALKIASASYLDQAVVKIGYPYHPKMGFEGFVLSVTRGSISMLNIEGYSYITAPVNPGDSGGPTINSDGEIIGINSHYYPQNNSYYGICSTKSINEFLVLED